MRLFITDKDDLDRTLDILPEATGREQQVPVSLRIRFISEMPTDLSPPVGHPGDGNLSLRLAAVLMMLGAHESLDMRELNRVWAQAEWGRVEAVEISW